MFHGKGGYTWNDVYNMPIWLRNFTFNSIKEFYNPKEDPVVPQNTNDTQIRVPDFVYKTSKK